MAHDVPHPGRIRRDTGAAQPTWHPAYQGPNCWPPPKQLWSWDITKLRGPVKGQFYYLYVILDVFSRYIPGWLIAERIERVRKN